VNIARSSEDKDAMILTEKHSDKKIRPFANRIELIKLQNTEMNQ